MLVRKYPKLIWVLIAAMSAFLSCPSVVSAADDTLLTARAELRTVYGTRADLRSLFDANTWLPTNAARIPGIRNLEDWAVKYGYKEHGSLWWYQTANAKATLAALNNESVPTTPRALKVVDSVVAPRKVALGQFDFGTVTADSVYVVDADSRRVLLAKNSEDPKSDAATAKLMTAAIVTNQGIDLEQFVASSAEDEIGGLRAEIVVGTRLTVRDWLYASLTGSANNATRTTARATGLSTSAFTAKMNETARTWGLTSATTFADPSGIVEGTVTTVSDSTAVLIEALENDDIRRVTTTGTRRLGSGLTVSNRNVLLTDPNNGLYVFGGQLGFMRASGWHMSVKLMDLKKEKPLVISVAGADSQEQLFAEVERIARWIWASYDWTAETELTLAEARTTLSGIYAKRGDLQTLFDSTSWQPVRVERTVGIANLEDWAAKYGYREHAELWWYGTERARLVLAGEVVEVAPKQVVSSAPRALQVRSGGSRPTKTSAANFSMSSITSDAVFVIDVPTRQVLLAQNAEQFRVLASLTKLMTGLVAIENGPPLNAMSSITSADEIGGARLRVPVDTALSMQDLMYSMLVGSANNAAHAIARTSAGSTAAFVTKMNDKAKLFGLLNTTFADPSGLNVENVSTAREVAALALEAWDVYDLRKMCSTASYKLTAAGVDHTIVNTNELLTDETNGLTVLGGKTGYLEESLWNLAVRLTDERQKQILVVVLGSDTKAQLFRDAHTVADWVWSNYRWQ
ncbi:MAG: hypothetical protein V1738_06570 [Patescibacteria group bacterium]